MLFRLPIAVLAGGLVGALAISPAVAGSTLDAVKQRGFLQCGLQVTGPGLSHLTEAGQWTGFFVDYCRAVAAATLGKADAVDFLATDAGNRFDALREGEIDLLSSVSTWTLSRDVALGLNFAAVLYYDGQGFLAHSSLGGLTQGRTAVMTPGNLNF